MPVAETAGQAMPTAELWGAAGKDLGERLAAARATDGRRPSRRPPSRAPRLRTIRGRVGPARRNRDPAGWGRQRQDGHGPSSGPRQDCGKPGLVARRISGSAACSGEGFGQLEGRDPLLGLAETPCRAGLSAHLGAERVVRPDGSRPRRAPAPADALDRSCREHGVGGREPPPPAVPSSDRKVRTRRAGSATGFAPGSSGLSPFHQRETVALDRPTIQAGRRPDGAEPVGRSLRGLGERGAGRVVPGDPRGKRHRSLLALDSLGSASFTDADNERRAARFRSGGSGRGPNPRPHAGVDGGVPGGSIPDPEPGAPREPIVTVRIVDPDPINLTPPPAPGPLAQFGTLVAQRPTEQRWSRLDGRRKMR